MTRLPPHDPEFETELLAAMNDFADRAPVPRVDAAAIVRRTARRRAAVAGAVAVAVAAGLGAGGLLLASPSPPGAGGRPAAQAPAASPTPAATPAAPAPSPPPGPLFPGPHLPGPATPSDGIPYLVSPLARPPEAMPTRQGPPVTVPALAGFTREAAARALWDAGLRGEVQEVADGSVPAGRVVSTGPSAGARVPAGSTVRVLVSTGRPGG